MSAATEQRKKILVVDDEPDVCVYLTRLLEESGYAAMTAGNGNEAMDRVEKERPDLITLDLSMPDKSGVRFSREIKAKPEFNAIPVIFITGVTGPGGNPADTERFYRTRSQVPPPEGFIAKPVDPQELITLVKKLIRHN
jgi:CheY-like chemotaxis protein